MSPGVVTIFPGISSQTRVHTSVLGIRAHFGSFGRVNLGLVVSPTAGVSQTPKLSAKPFTNSLCILAG